MELLRFPVSERFQMKFTMVFFKIIGLIPFTVIFTNKNPECNVSRIGYVYNIVLIVLIFGADLLCIPNIYSLQFISPNALTQRLILTKAIVGTIALFLLWFIMCFRQKYLVNIFNRLVDVDNDLLELNHLYVLQNANTRLILLFISNIVIWICVFGTDGFTYLNANVLEWLTMLIPMMIPSLIVNWLLILYTMLLCIMEIRFKSVNKAIIRISRVPEIIDANSYDVLALRIHQDRSVIRALLAIKRAHSKFYEISNDIAHFYSIPLLIAITFFCGTIIYSAYYVIVPLIRTSLHEQVILNTVNGIFMLAMQLFPIITMAICVNKLTHEMNMTGDAVHKLLAWSIPCREVRSELKKFSLELLHQNVEFTAHGVFPLDCTLVHSICSIVVTYLIILVQFQRGLGH